MSHYFEISLGLGETQDKCKPEPDGLISVLNQMDFSPKEAIYVGDSTIDLIAAKRAQILPVLIDRSGNKEIDPTEIGQNEYTIIKELFFLVLREIQDGIRKGLREN